MLSFLKGNPVEVINDIQNKTILILEVNNMGYEIQILSRFSQKIVENQLENIQVFTCLQIRDDYPILYGFATVDERDLFRQLINVNGIGAQLAIALIDTLGLEKLVQAIINGNTRSLSKTPGVGQKTAERIILEFKNKLSQFKNLLGKPLSSSAAIPSLEVLEDLEITLLALGYTNKEINQAVSTLSKDNQILKNHNGEDWIKEAIIWLNQNENLT
ncbi:Holliday junction branch migration protein RuvA [cyanobacterium endosymbiont of Epithemia turgida]|uniref:Holliday junction branch migration protein RuvA n=1 Tax=cyanobacterium endosymbiont of Epithemia turgida TaxID=718217 RepID=UPI0004D1224A|nr:Holliday junction branch migration protein RuvA [cyanobacterium endosymbiont of Epithemia turgida]BAP18306.1 Holliday junction DNA helicase RuvA [cyanobacterium endosymbiont of Epithemia turgida isolate EtSB Lake Yunoko]